MFNEILNAIEAFFAKYQELAIISESLTTWQDQMLTAHNAQRVRRVPLTINLKLQAAAQGYADYMAKTGVLSHTGQDGSTMVSRINAQGYHWSTIGENIAYGYPTVSSVMNGWMQSYGHRMNIMNPSFNEAGFGKGVSSKGVIYWCVDFGHQM